MDQGWWVNWGHHGHTFTNTYTLTHTYCKCTQKRGNTGERLLLWTSLTILCLGKKNINLPSLKGSALLSHLQPTWARMEWSPPHPLNPSRRGGHPLIVSTASPNEGPKAPCTINIGRGWGVGALQFCLEAGQWVMGVLSCLYCQRRKIFTCLRMKLSGPVTSTKWSGQSQTGEMQQIRIYFNCKAWHGLWFLLYEIFIRASEGSLANTLSFIPKWPMWFRGVVNFTAWDALCPKN